MSDSLQSLLTLPGSRRKPVNLVRISSLLISNGCLWTGGSNGTIMTVPLTSDKPRSKRNKPMFAVDEDEEEERAHPLVGPLRYRWGWGGGGSSGVRRRGSGGSPPEFFWIFRLKNTRFFKFRGTLPNVFPRLMLPVVVAQSYYCYQ